MWHGCCHGEAPCSGNVLSIVEGTQPSLKILYMPANTLKPSYCRYHRDCLPLWESRWMAGGGGHHEEAGKKWNMPFPVSEGGGENDSSFKTMTLNSFKGKKKSTMPKIKLFYVTCTIFMHQNEGKSKGYRKWHSFLRPNEEIIQFQVYMVNNPGHIHHKQQVK